MDKRTVLLLFFILLVLAGQILGESGPPIYVSTFTLTGVGQILSVDGTTGATTVVYTSTDNVRRPEDITVGPDNKLYVCAPTNGLIVRMDQDGKNFETVYDQAGKDLSKFPVGPQGPRFDSAGTLFFNTKGSGANGVWKIKNLTDPGSHPPFPDPVNVLQAADSGEGLAFTASGGLLVVKRDLGEVQCLPGPLKTCPDKITGLTNPIGIAVSSVGDIFVARRSSLTSLKPGIERITPKNEQSTYVEFEPLDQPFYLEIIDKTLFVATTADPGDGTPPNGKLWKVTPPDGKCTPDPIACKTPLANLPTQSLVGVGKPATSVSITKTIDPSGGTKVWNFDTNAFEITAPGACTATIIARQRPPAEVNAMLVASGIKGKAQAQSGDEGWVTTWLIQPSGCPVLSNDLYGIAIFAYVNEPFNISPGIASFSSPTVGKQLQDFGYYPYTEAKILGDPISSTKSRSFSEYLFVNLQLAYVGSFCGFLPPLNPDPNNPAVFLIGNTVPIKFQLKAGKNCTGSFITDAKAVLSVAQLELGDGTPTFDRKVVNPAGKANEPPNFRSDGPTKQYIFNLNTSGWPAGKYAATVTSNKSFPQTILFRLQ